MSGVPPVETITTPEALQARLDAPGGLLVWFTQPDCGVCTVLWPRVRELVRDEFPRLRLARVDSRATPDVAARCAVFTVPTLLLFFDGRESLRLARHFGLDELRRGLERPYGLYHAE